MVASAVSVEGALKLPRSAIRGIQSGSSVACMMEGGRKELRTCDTGRKMDDLSFDCRGIASRKGVGACFDFAASRDRPS